jgi:SAM-dependent methyltransferase
VVTDDTLLRREVDRALLRLARAVPSDDRLDPDATPAAPLALRYACRAGLEEVLRDELPIAWSPRLGAPGTVLARAAASLTALHAPRCFAELAFELRARRRQPDDDLAAHVAAMMTSPEATAILQTYTRGALRWRVVWTRGGHRRALVEAVERAVAARLPGSVNDPQRALWTLEVDDDPRGVRAVLVPWWKDTRFAYRVAEMPAASNPLVAAALARVAGVAPDDVVVDPFCGTALELIERARLGAYRALHGRDLSAEAIAKARQNFTAAGITDARVAQGDAFDRLPEGTTLVLTNPPLGYRVGFGAPTDRILVRFVEHAARALASGGRLVWLSSAPEATAEAGRRAGLRVSLRRAVDLAGMAVELQRMDKP